MNDSWSSEDGAAWPALPRRADRHQADPPGAEPRPSHAADPADRHGRYPWVGLAFLLVGLLGGGIGLTSIGLALDRPGVSDVAEGRWWLVVGGSLAIAWSSPWFLAPRGRRRMAIALGIGSLVVLAVAAVGITSLGG